ncbi:hypothetical protein [Streptomyces sp. NPDC048606]|uniref:hypothetical protein n=1 Tax=Streptomyces sp. NPDC048606 TaxID=3154726 RepID=UPI00342A0297
MYEEKHPAATRPGHVCPTCKQPLPATVRRHKTMGVYVPLYDDAPCANPSCRESGPAERRASEPDASGRSPGP